MPHVEDIKSKYDKDGFIKKIKVTKLWSQANNFTFITQINVQYYIFLLPKLCVILIFTKFHHSMRHFLSEISFITVHFKKNYHKF